MKQNYNLYQCATDSKRTFVISKLSGDYKKRAERVTNIKDLAEFVMYACYESSDLTQNFEEIYDAFKDDPDNDLSIYDVQEEESLNVNLRIQEACKDTNFIKACLSTWFPNLSESIINKIAKKPIYDEFAKYNFAESRTVMAAYNCDPTSVDDTFDTDYNYHIYYDGGIWFTYCQNNYIPFFALTGLYVDTMEKDVCDIVYLDDESEHTHCQCSNIYVPETNETIIVAKIQSTPENFINNYFKVGYSDKL